MFYWFSVGKLLKFGVGLIGILLFYIIYGYSTIGVGLLKYAYNSAASSILLDNFLFDSFFWLFG